MDPITISLFLLLFLLFLGEILLLVTPIDISLDIERFNKKTELISIVSFGILQFRTDSTAGFTTLEILISGRHLYRFSVKETEKEVTGKGMAPPDIGIRSLEPLMRHGPGLFRGGMKFLGGILHAISIHTLEMNIRLGFMSSALTGILFGYFSVLKAVLCPARRLQLTMTPVFGEEVLEGRVLLLLRVSYPIRIIAAGFRFLLGRNMRRLLLDIRKEMHHE